MEFWRNPAGHSRYRVLGPFARCSVPSLRISGLDCRDIYVQSLSECSSPSVRQPHFSALQRADHRCADLDQLSELRLREPRQDSEISKTSVPRLPHFDQLADLTFERDRNLSQRINLRRTTATLPISDGIHTDAGSAREVPAGHPQLDPARPESFWHEAMKDSPTHALPSLTMGHRLKIAGNSHSAEVAPGGIVR